MLSSLISATHARCEALAPDVGGKVSGPQLNIHCEQIRITKSDDQSKNCFPFSIRVATTGADYRRFSDYYFYALKICLCAITPTSSHVTWCHRGLAWGQPTSKQYLECGEKGGLGSIQLISSHTHSAQHQAGVDFLGTQECCEFILTSHIVYNSWVSMALWRFKWFMKLMV